MGKLLEEREDGTPPSGDAHPRWGGEPDREKPRAGGMHGKITAVEDTVVTIEVANGVNIKFNKGHVAAIIEK